MATQRNSSRARASSRLTFDERLAQLCAFVRRHGHCDVRSTHRAPRGLATWVAKQHQRYREGKLDRPKRRALEDLGIEWKLEHRPSFAARLAQLRAFARRHGHCDVSTVGRSRELGTWLSHQRTRYHEGRLAPERHRMLTELGVRWRIKRPAVRRSWESYFRELRAFEAKHGHSDVPQHQPKLYELARWVRRQREAYHAGRLSARRIRRLEQLAFRWSPRADIRAERLAELRAVVAEIGHGDISGVSSTYPTLNQWVKDQRKLWSQGRLSPAQKRELLDAGFAPDAYEARWQAKLAELRAFAKEFGHTCVPQRYAPNRPLGGWVSRQREALRAGKISKEHLAILDRLGFVWYPERRKLRPRRRRRTHRR